MSLLPHYVLDEMVDSTPYIHGVVVAAVGATQAVMDGAQGANEQHDERKGDQNA